MLGSLVAVAFVPSLVRAQKPLGIDVSHWQATVNWTSVKNSGVTFAWAKATEGMNTDDDYFVGNQVNAKAAGVLIGAYHFAHPESNTPAEEAAHYWNVAKNYIVGDGAHLMPMLDMESFSGITGATSYSDWANQWCNIIVSNAAAAGVYVKPVIYTSACFACNFNSTISQWPAWIANYNGQPPQTGGPWSSCSSCATASWGSGFWHMWQYSSTGSVPGVSGNCDQDVFNGTATQFNALFIITNLGPPSITSQPSSRYADRGSSITLRASANGAPTLKYQWRLYGTNIAGATTNSYALSNIQTNHAGPYTLVVTNNSGSITSSPALLTVNPLFAPVFADNFDVNSAANWTLSQSSADTRVAFAYNYSGYGIPSAPNSVGGTTKGVKFEANVSAGVASALSISPVGQNFGGNYRLHYDLWMNANGPFPAGGTGSTQHHTSGVGTPGNHIQWGSQADGVWFGVDGEGQATDALPDFRAYVGTALQSSNSGVYAAGISPSARRADGPYYANVFPGGQGAPAVQAQSGQLNVGTIGFAWRDVVVNKTGNVIEWFIDGLKIASVTNSLTYSNIFIGYWDSFNSLSGNTNLSFGLVDNLRVEVPAVAPAISAQPTSVAVKVTSNATFTVTATGIPAPGYLWRFNGLPIAGATTSSYTVSNVQYTNAGNYSVLITNAMGSINSSNALLSIVTASPAQFQAFTLQPDQSLQVTLAGDPGAVYFIETSTNMVNWLPLTNVTLSGATISFNIGSNAGEPERYFRARSGP